MLAQLLAAGALELAGTNASVFAAPVSRTVVVASSATTPVVASTLPLDAAKWLKPFDPSSNQPYGFDWTAELATDEKIATVLRVGVSASGAALGVAVDTAAKHAPAIDGDGKKVSVWFLVDPLFQSNAAFLGEGVQVAVAMQVQTDSNPPETIEISNILTVRQR